MNPACISFRRRVVSHILILIVLFGVVFTTLSVLGQSMPAPLMPDCMRGSALRGTSSAGGLGKPESAAVATGAASQMIKELRGVSFPELGKVDLRVRTFHSRSDYFRTRFSIVRFLLPTRMRYFVEVNPALFQAQAPADGLCAILAHELVHIVSLSRGNRIRRFDLVRLLSTAHTVKFERGADLDAIHRGYGDGLKSYRAWVYGHIPPSKLPEKLRNYFSPEEIAAIQVKLQEHPELLVYWRKHVPVSLHEIESGQR